MDIKSKNAIEIMLIMAIIFIATYAIVFSIKTPTTLGQSSRPVTSVGEGGGGGDDVQDPVIAITSPTIAQSFSGTINVTATATDNVGVTKVDFYLDDSFIGSDSVSPYSISWQTPDATMNGGHTFKAIAFDARGNDATAKTTIAIANKAPTDEKSLFIAHFETSANADFSIGNKIPTTNTGTTIVPGKYGNGILVDSTDKLYYSAKSNFNPTQGTIEMWVKPNWNGSSWTVYDFFGIGSGDISGDNFQFQNDGGYICAMYNNYGVCSTQLLWQANEWHHIATTWGKRGREIFIDGKQVNVLYNYQPVIQNIPADFAVGLRYDGLRQANAVIDELRISNVQRSEEEIRESAGIPTTNDDIAPTVEIVWPTDLPYYTTYSTPIALSGYAKDNVGVTRVRAKKAENGQLFEGTFDISSGKWWVQGIQLSPGKNVIIVDANDAAGNTGSDTIKINYVQELNPPTITITSPTSSPTYSTIQPIINLGGTATDDANNEFSGLSTIYAELTIGGVTKPYLGDFYWFVNGSDSNALSTFNVPEFPIITGTNTIKVFAWDQAGNQNTDTITVTKLGLTDGIVIMEPTANPTYKTSDKFFKLAGLASPTTWKVQYSVNNSLYKTATGTNPWDINSFELKPGTNTIDVIACDFGCANYSTDTIIVKMIVPQLAEVYFPGNYIKKLEGLNQYAGKPMNARFVQLIKRSNGTFDATFELYDSNSILVDTKTVSAGTQLNAIFIDVTGGPVLKTSLLVSSIEGNVNTDGTISGLVKIIRQIPQPICNDNICGPGETTTCPQDCQ